MSVKEVLNQTSLPLLEQVMDQSALRQKTYASNLANVSTPGYKRRDVRFEDEMRSVRLETTQPGHRGLNETTRPPSVQPTADEDGDFSVDVDREMVAIAENQLRFNLAARLAALRLAGIRASIRGGR